MVCCLIAFGGNLGASNSTFETALEILRRPGIEPLRISRIFRTRPVGTDAGAEFLNAAATLDCTLPPDALLSALHDVESQFGRTRTIHWGPRTLDLDLILFGEHVVEEPGLVVPHPAMWYRRFVLDPAIDVAMEMIHPIQKLTVAELHRRLHVRPVHLSIQCSRHMSSRIDLKYLRETLAAENGEIGWTIIGETSSVLCGEIAEPDSDDFFARIVIEGTSSKPQQRTQPANSGSRSISVYGDTQASIVDQLTQLSAAIFG